MTSTSGLIARLRNSLAGRPIVVGPQEPIVVAPTPPVVVALPPPRPAWLERRWERKDTGQRVEYMGHYTVVHRASASSRSFQGCIIEADGAISVFIIDPPEEVKRHPLGPCFQFHRAPWFRLHFRRGPDSVDAALLYMEKLLEESINEVRS